MTYEDEEFNRIERESKQRMQAVQYALDRKAENARELGLDYEPDNKSSLFDNGVYVGSHIGKEVKHTSLDHQPWVGLTDEELSAIYNHADWNINTDWNYERAIEAKLKEKNT